MFWRRFLFWKHVSTPLSELEFRERRKKKKKQFRTPTSDGNNIIMDESRTNCNPNIVVGLQNFVRSCNVSSVLTVHTAQRFETRLESNSSLERYKIVLITATKSPENCRFRFNSCNDSTRSHKYEKGIPTGRLRLYFWADLGLL